MSSLAGGLIPLGGRKASVPTVSSVNSDDDWDKDSPPPSPPVAAKKKSKKKSSSKSKKEKGGSKGGNLSPLDESQTEQSLSFGDTKGRTTLGHDPMSIVGDAGSDDYILRGLSTKPTARKGVDVAAAFGDEFEDSLGLPKRNSGIATVKASGFKDAAPDLSSRRESIRTSVYSAPPVAGARTFSETPGSVELPRNAHQGSIDSFDPDDLLRMTDDAVSKDPDQWRTESQQQPTKRLPSPPLFGSPGSPGSQSGHGRPPSPIRNIRGISDTSTRPITNAPATSASTSHTTTPAIEPFGRKLSSHNNTASVPAAASVSVPEPSSGRRSSGFDYGVEPLDSDDDSDGGGASNAYMPSFATNRPSRRENATGRGAVSGGMGVSLPAGPLHLPGLDSSDEGVAAPTQAQPRAVQQRGRASSITSGVNATNRNVKDTTTESVVSRSNVNVQGPSVSLSALGLSSDGDNSLPPAQQPSRTSTQYHTQESSNIDSVDTYSAKQQNAPSLVTGNNNYPPRHSSLRANSITSMPTITSQTEAVPAPYQPSVTQLPSTTAQQPVSIQQTHTILPSSTSNLNANVSNASTIISTAPIISESPGSRTATTLQRKRSSVGFNLGTSQAGKNVISGGTGEAAWVAARSPGTSVAASAEAAVAALRWEQHTAETQRLRLELESAKGRASAASSLEAELSQARQKIAVLEAERAMLVSRMASAEVEHAEALNLEQQRSTSLRESAQRLHEQESASRAEQHAAAIQSLRRLHMEELDAVRKRSADGKALEGLAHQVASSAASLKLLQSQLVEQRIGTEVVQIGQIEARERLVGELEGNARRAQHAAEEEIQRLQGVLSAMDSVMTSLRGQNSEERERLRQEHMRLEALQGSLIAEAEGARQGLEAERRRFAVRWTTFAEEKAAERMELTHLRSELEESRARLQHDREALAALQKSATQAVEEASQRVKNGEAKVQAARASLSREAALFEERVRSARSELRAADMAREQAAHENDERQEEMRRVATAAREVERASQEVAARSAEAEAWLAEAERLHSEGTQMAVEAREAKTALQQQAAGVRDLQRMQEMDRTSIAQARMKALCDRSEARRLRAELQSDKAKLTRQLQVTAPASRPYQHEPQPLAQGVAPTQTVNRLGVMFSGNTNANTNTNAPIGSELERLLRMSAAHVRTNEHDVPLAYLRGQAAALVNGHPITTKIGDSQTSKYTVNNQSNSINSLLNNVSAHNTVENMHENIHVQPPIPPYVAHTQKQNPTSVDTNISGNNSSQPKSWYSGTSSIHAHSVSYDFDKNFGLSVSDIRSQLESMENRRAENMSALGKEEAFLAGLRRNK